MIVTLKNITTSPLSTDLGLVQPGATVSTTMGPMQLYLASLNIQKLESAGYVTFSVSEETAAGLAAALPSSLAGLGAREPLADASGTMGFPNGSATTADSSGMSSMLVLHKAFAGGSTGPAADVTIYAAGAVPYKMRLVDAMFHTDKIQAGDDTMQLWSGALGTGNQLSDASSTASAGVLRQTQVGTQGTLL